MSSLAFLIIMVKSLVYSEKFCLEPRLNFKETQGCIERVYEQTFSENFCISLNLNYNKTKECIEIVYDNILDGESPQCSANLYLEKQCEGFNGEFKTEGSL